MNSESKRGARRAFLRGAAALAATGLVNSRAQAAEFNFRFGNNQPPSYPINVRMREAAQRIRDASGGRVSVQVFPAGQLGTDTDMLSQVRSGALHFYTASGLVLSTLVPVSAINATGFAFTDYGQVWKAMDGELGAHIRANIEKSGLMVFDKIFDIGFRQISSNAAPVRKPEDMKGFKIRVPPSQLGVSLFRALGASPVTLNWGETYTALQTHVVDGQENPLSIIESGKFYEVQKYCSMTAHMWDGFWLLGHAPSFRRMPGDLQAIVAREFDRAVTEERVDIAKLESSMRGILAKGGMTFVEPERGNFRTALQHAGFYKEWRGKFGDPAWKLLEKYAGALA